MIDRPNNIDQGYPKPIPKKKPLQFKRGSSKAFRRVNPVLLNGEPAYEWDTKKLKVGDGRTRYNLLPYIGDHTKPKDGKSAYQLWIEQGNQGTVNDFLESLIGEQGKSTYEIWLDLGHQGTEADFINSLKGKSAYDIWKDQGHEGDESDFINYMCTMSWENF